MKAINNGISVVIITFNEEDNIFRCIESVKDLADEVIVVDSFSKDRTKELCLSYDVSFYERVFDGYSSQKRYANSLARYDYILSLDADEALSDQLKQSILNEKQDFRRDGYFMSRMNNYCGRWIRHGAWYPDNKLRLFNKHKGEWNHSIIHELVEMKNNSRIGNLNGDILHYSYTSLEGHILQLNNFTTLMAAEQFKKRKKVPLYKVYLSPTVSFVKGFFIKLAFLDGYYGVLICIINAFATYMKYAKLHELNLNEQQTIKNLSRIRLTPMAPTIHKKVLRASSF